MKKVALVTGSTQGIGLGIAQALIEKNYIVYINGRRSEAVNATVNQLGSSAKGVTGDVCDPSFVTGLFQQIISNDGHIDLVVSNVGSGRSTPGWKATLDDYRKSFDTNFFSSVSVCRTALESMEKRGGHIIAIASIAGCESLTAPIAYTSAKSALIAFTKGLSDQTAAIGVRVNSISPGNVMFEGSVWDKKKIENSEQVARYIENRVPLQTFVTPEDIAKGVLFLDESPTITGSNLVIDGGQLRRLI